ncbi:Anaerobic sulfatase-maturating enzyme [Propionibacterium freudenreichii]|nr:Anaerobic sulfatase-maturating enzyme [Propionibacterium freudenreichii]SCC98108.1 Anaerobic sulfatase-maturating enzyme [Propionibacterium freudenreichii]
MNVMDSPSIGPGVDPAPVRGPLRAQRGSRGVRPAPHVMAKPAGPTCNMECTYCFYLDKQALFPRSSLRMTPEVVRAVLQDAIDASPDTAIQFCWQGGEPTLRGLDFYREAFAVARRIVPPGRHFAWSMQTNGVLIDERWAEFLARHDVLVGLSIDGPRDVHDRWRVDRGGRGTWAKVMRAARLLHEHGVRFNTFTTVHPANQHRGAEVYRFLRDEVGSDFHQYIPIVVPDPARPGHVVRGLSVDPGASGEFQVDVFSQWLHRDVGQVFVMNVEWALAAWCGDEPASCMFREHCGDAVVVEHDGSVYSCDHFVDPARREPTRWRALRTGRRSTTCAAATGTSSPRSMRRCATWRRACCPDATRPGWCPGPGSTGSWCRRAPERVDVPRRRPARPPHVCTSGFHILCAPGCRSPADDAQWPRNEAFARPSRGVVHRLHRL